MSTPWLMEWLAAARPERLLVCCHHAGGGAGQFRRWRERLAPGTTVLALQLPGRQSRWDEPVPRSMEEAVTGAFEALRHRIDRPYTVFGHSMGALVGYETARRLGAEAGLWPERLIASASLPPHRPQGVPELRGLDDAGLIGYFVGNGTLPGWVADDPDLQRLLLAPLRGDIALCDGYRHRPGPPLPCPITVCGGLDDTGLDARDLDGWRAYGSAGCERRMFRGGHLFHLEPDSGLLPFLASLAAPVPSATPASLPAPATGPGPVHLQEEPR
ncbi:thioesterase II family protein [Streptomyces sp. NPDC050560]|uniref:thioesterase II family protein n=1 Tax=Streptomyces sp. NPDC050560 TaxID=3365630 RepID=UPI00378F5F1A